MHRECRGPGEDEDEVDPSGRSGRASVKARCGCFVRGSQVLKVRFVPEADIILVGRNLLPTFVDDATHNPVLVCSGRPV